LGPGRCGEKTRAGRRSKRVRDRPLQDGYFTLYGVGGIKRIGQAAYLFGIRAHLEGRLVGDG
jgi:hypothetical protein